MDSSGDFALPTLDAADPPELVPLPGGPFRLWPVAALRAAGFPIAPLAELGSEEYAALADRLFAAQTAARGSETEELRAAREEFDVASDTEQRRQSDLLMTVAGRADFQEAITWQNHAILHQVVRGLSHTLRNRRLRPRLRAVARYWARYCAKNETVGFFGPVCWISVGQGGDAVAVRPGPNLIRSRTVFVEGWPVDVLAAKAGEDARLRPWLAPRRSPMVYLDGTLLRHLAGPPVPLDPMTARLIERCDGERTARQIAAEFVADPQCPFGAEDQVFAVFDRLTQHSVLYWDLDQPVRIAPERGLRRALERIGDAPLRAAALAPLRELDAGRDRVAAAGTVDELDTAMTDLETTFVAATGAGATTNAGQTYGGRQLLYMDAVRDLDMRVGGPVLDALGAPLSILLHGARWLTQEIGREYHHIFLEAYEKLEAEQGSGEPVDLVAMLQMRGGAITDLGNRPLERAMGELTERFQRLFGLDTAAGHVHHDSADLAPRAAEVFGDARAGWAQAHHHNIDVQIAASSVEAIHRGDFQLVLGEFHLAWNPLESGVFAPVYPDARYLPALLAASYPRPRVMLSPLKGFPRVSSRTVPAVVRDDDWWVSVGAHSDGRPERRLALAGMVVEREGDRLRARTRDGRASFDLVDIGGSWGAWEIVDSFKLVSRDRPHTPRVTVDRMVVCRESWTVPVSDCSFATFTGEAAGFVAARGWAKRLGLPRFVFAKLSSELKPFYVDFASPVLVGSLASSIRAARERAGDANTVTFSEMLPGPDQVWLPDAAGNRYTSELRLTVIDPVLP